MKKNIIPLLLAVCVALASCQGEVPAEKSTAKTENVSGGQPSSVTDEVKTGREYIKDSIPDDIDLGGAEIGIYCRDGNNEIDVESATEDIINDAVYDRARRVEERLKCKIKMHESGSDQVQLANAIRTIIKSESDDCDLICVPRYHEMALAAEGYFYNVYECPQIDLTAPWWQKGFTEAATLLDNKVYLISGTASITSVTNAGGILINKNIYEEKVGDVNELYKTVIDRKWTLDELVKACKDVYADVNGDGNRDNGDLYGLIMTPNTAMVDWYNALGVELSSKGSDGLPYISMNNDHTASVYSKTLEILYSTVGSYCPGASQEAYDLSLEKFENGSAMFVKGAIGSVAKFRSMSDDFSIIPFPMYDEAQGEYRSYLPGYATVWGIPVSAPDPDSSATFLEAFASDGYRYVIPKVYEDALKYAYSRDDMQAIMMDIISENVRLSFVNLHSASISGIEYFLTTLWANKTENFTSSYDAKGGAFEKALSDLIEKYKSVF